MATVDELVEQFETDSELQEEISRITEDNKITPMKFLTFTKNHDLKVSITELPTVVKKAKELGLIK